MNRNATTGAASPRTGDGTETLVSVRAGAQRLGLSEHTLRTWIREKRIAYVKLGRRTLLDPRTLERFVRDHVVRAAR